MQPIPVRGDLRMTRPAVAGLLACMLKAPTLRRSIHRTGAKVGNVIRNSQIGFAEGLIVEEMRSCLTGQCTRWAII